MHVTFSLKVYRALDLPLFIYHTIIFFGRVFFKGNLKNSHPHRFLDKGVDSKEEKIQKSVR